MAFAAVLLKVNTRKYIYHHACFQVLLKYRPQEFQFPLMGTQRIVGQKVSTKS